MPRPRTPDCHPDRPHYAGGLCRACYQQQKRAEYDRRYEQSDKANRRAKRYEQTEKGKARKRNWAARTRQETAIKSDRDLVLEFAQSRGDWISVSDLRMNRRRFTNADAYPRAAIAALFQELADSGEGEVAIARSIRFRANP